MLKNHQFHLVNPSPWPIVVSLILMNYTSSMIMMMNTKKFLLFNLTFLILIWTMLMWWRDIQRESTFQGNHTSHVMKSMKYGMILFIFSEIFFFISFFWNFFHHSLVPSQEIGLYWPPKNIQTLNPMHIPLINTLILLSSGISVTWAHASMNNKKFISTKKSLMLTVLLGIYFSFLQIMEYNESSFTISDSVYGSSFFITTGFHGIHVIIGTIFLVYALNRLNSIFISHSHHLNLEMSIWYWHFVDIIWLFLYISIYWWGN
uniref:Cytochrome c oxidase subunit 3 n=1 Tax=Mycopsylla proxima TaxID=1681221 RepID=A0A343UQT2_9HEMI|nr:cytochrome c oxidase subunit III [Mycopsylla proxima]AVF97057.1 cytochrome c oxidase subunit III [Mycopsylla proxima]